MRKLIGVKGVGRSWCKRDEPPDDFVEKAACLQIAQLVHHLDQCVVGGLKIALRNGVAHELR